MPEFLDVIENIRAEEANASRLWGDAGRPVRGNQDPRYLERLAEAAEFVSGVFRGRIPLYRLQEAMTTSDFPLLFGDVLDRQLLARYRETAPTYRAYARVSTVRDFRPAKRFAVDGAEGILDEVAEQAPYPAAALSEAADTLQVAKRGRRLPFSWEALVNDDLGALSDSIDRLGRGARRSEEHFATTLFVDSSGPHASLYDSSNTVDGNPALSIEALQSAFTLLASQTDEDGQPILIDAVTLVVPPALEVVANNILNATQIRSAVGSGASSDQLVAVNWMTNRVSLAVNYYIPAVADTNGTTSWFLFASPQTSRPAIEMAFLRQHTEPALFVKQSDARRVGGMGGPEGDLASFDNDSVEYKVRHVFGGARLTNTGGKRATVASSGAGS